ncbi:Hypothetical_protein [Hexamita inflata]|uniref:Hypothetical_protein n=1 Tax=Hexamita inflata TaxID=28002 RepID=A0AA86PBS1_9EUKA|nr:Hypothetical protein HINF_LOCUS634 [Hexamita inflata]CAI9934851.1 Hypothetical protein HINF_LOCUS22496 [Hexamita inflata]
MINILYSLQLNCFTDATEVILSKQSRTQGQLSNSILSENTARVKSHSSKMILQLFQFMFILTSNSKQNSRQRALQTLVTFLYQWSFIVQFNSQELTEIFAKAFQIGSLTM